MKYLLASFICLILLSCNSYQQDGWQLATDFHKNYASDFIQNQELLKYSYNPRSQFYYDVSGDESRTFRCLNRDSIKLIVVNFGGFDIFQQEFKIKLDTLIPFRIGEITKESTKFKLIVNDSVPVQILSVGRDPIQHFVQLRRLIDEYGIVTYRKILVGGIIRVYLTAYDYLLYFPTNYKIKQKQFEEHWRNKQKNGKMLDNNWYYYRSERPLDLG